MILDFFINEIDFIFFGEVREVLMIIRIGIYIEIIVVMNGLMLNIFYFDWVIRYGVVIINIVNYDWVGYFVIEVNIINFVSFVYIFKRGVWIDFMIINLFIIND